MVLPDNRTCLPRPPTNRLTMKKLQPDPPDEDNEEDDDIDPQSPEEELRNEAWDKWMERQERGEEKPSDQLQVSPPRPGTGL